MASKEEEKVVPKYAELRDIPQVTLAEAAAQIRLSLEFHQRRGCIVLVGDSGIGKTQIWSQIAHDTGYTVVPIHTAHWGLMGSGIPVRTLEDFFKVAVPEIFPKGDEKKIILFDELNRGLKHAINQFFTMMEDGRMFNYVVPKQCLVAGTMNPSTAEYNVTSIENEAAIRRRVKFFYVLPDLKGFMKHAATERFHLFGQGAAKDKACHPGILDYFRAKPNNIYDWKALKEQKQYNCPANIETISEDSYNMEAKGIPLNSEFAMQRFAASIGVTMASELSAHLKDSSLTIGADDVLRRFSKVKNAIQKMVDNAMHEPLADLDQNVLRLMFATTPDVEDTAKNFLKFIELHPLEMAGAMLFQMRSIAEENKSEEYLNSLMRELQDYDSWCNLQLEIDNNYRGMEEKIRS